MSSDAAESVAYCVPGGQNFQSVYVQFHGYISLIICLLGSAANSVNIAVLSRKEMASSTNTILTGLAVADLLVMIDYIPFALHIYIKIGSEHNRNSYGWAVFVYFHSIFSQTFHTISIWLTITLAVWRFIAIKFPQKNRTLCNQRNTNIAIAVAYAVCPILCLPIYFAMNIRETVIPQKSDNTTWNDTDVANVSSPREPAYALQMTDNEGLLTAIFWIYSVFIKLIPCVVLSILSVLLILKMKSSDRRRQKLLKKSAITTHEGEKTRLNEDGQSGRRGGGGGRTDRTTRMLVALLGLFLATELPQALFGLLTAIAPHLFGVCYYSFGEVMDLMALVGSAVNFVLYCSMSRQFRSTFTRLARKCRDNNKISGDIGGSSHAGSGNADILRRKLTLLLVSNLYYTALTANKKLRRKDVSSKWEVMDLMALVGSAVNFVLYCSMSRQFRSTFTRLARKVLPLPRADGEVLAPLKA